MIAPFGPEPEIVGKLRDLKFLLAFLYSNNFSWAFISVIFFLQNYS